MNCESERPACVCLHVCVCEVLKTCMYVSARVCACMCVCLHVCVCVKFIAQNKY